MYEVWDLETQYYENNYVLMWNSKSHMNDPGINVDVKLYLLNCNTIVEINVAL